MKLFGYKNIILCLNNKYDKMHIKYINLLKNSF